MRKPVAFIGVLLSLGALGLLVWKIDLKSVREQLAHLGWGAWLAGVGVYLLAFLPRGVRWKIMLPGSKELPWGEVTRILVVGYAANNLLPFRLGEAVRSVVAGTRFGISKLTCLGTIAAEKVLDGCCLLALLALALQFVSIRSDSRSVFQPVAFLVAFGFGAGLLLCFAMARWEAQILGWADTRCAPKMRGRIQTVLAAVAVFKTPSTVVPALLLTLVVWCLEGLCFAWFLARLGAEGALAKGFFCLVVVNMSILIPSAPGYVGVFQAGAVAAMLALGADASQGLALAIVTHAAQFIPTTLLGILFVGAMDLSWRRLYHLRDE